MKLVATIPVRNEDWILGLSLRAALMWCDEVVVGLHCCDDDSARIASEIMRENLGRVFLHFEDDPVWSEMAHRQKLLEMARERGATHIAIVDADEVLTGNLISSIVDTIAKAPDGMVVQLPWLCLAGGNSKYYSGGIWAQQNVSMAFADHPHYFWKSRDGYDFHHRQPMGRPYQPYVAVNPFGPRTGGLMHLQFVSGRRLRAKQAFYKVTEVLRWPGREPVSEVDARYNIAVYGQRAPYPVEQPTSPCPGDWWQPYGHLMQHYHPHALPWQERMVQAAIAEHGLKRFAGLDLFGIGEREINRHEASV